MSNDITTKTADAPALAGVNFSALLGDPASNPEPTTAIEKALSTVTPEDAAAATVEEAKFSFRSLLTEAQRAQLKASAPAVAQKMIADYNAIINFGEPVLTKLNSTAVQMLNAQKDISVPEAETIVNDLLREMDGFEKKYRNAKMEDFSDKLMKWFKGTVYSFKTMVRESKPIAEKIDLAEVKLKEMEIKLSNNVSRGQQLHKNTTEILEEVVAVLAALEEILEVARAEFHEADQALKLAESKATAEGLASITYKGREVSLNELKEIHADLAGGVSELEKTWFDWRQQFFLGYAQAPSVRNLILVSSTMQRRCQVFRTMGLPAARNSLVMWQQAVLAKEGAEMGDAVKEGTNKLIQNAYGATADAVTEVARASQETVISEETVFAVIDSVKKQCEGLVAADQWGRELRARNLKALEAGEAQIDKDFTESRRKLVANALAGTSEAANTQAPMPEADVLTQLGVKK